MKKMAEQKVTTSVILSERQAAWISKKAVKCQTSMAAIIRQIIQAEIDRNGAR